MKLRLDLLEHLTDEDILEEVLANNPRYKPEPHFSKTGVGTLSSASTEQRAKEEERSTALIARAIKRSRTNDKPAKRKPSNFCANVTAGHRFFSSTATPSLTSAAK
jgi:hypothetical protein